MVAQRDEEIEEHGSTLFHLCLHGAAFLENTTSTHDECEIVCSQAAVVVGRVGVGVAHAAEDCAHVDAGLQTLLAKSKPLQFGKGVAPGGAVDGGVAKDEDVLRGEVKEWRVLGLAARKGFLRGGGRRGEGILWCASLEMGATRLGLEQTRAVVAFVQVLELGPA